MPVTACDMKFTLNVRWRQQFTGGYPLRNIGHVFLEYPNRSRLELLPRIVCPATLTLVGRILHDGRQHVFARRGQ